MRPNAYLDTINGTLLLDYSSSMSPRIVPLFLCQSNKCLSQWFALFKNGFAFTMQLQGFTFTVLIVQWRQNSILLF
jgi:hypothetical protein